MGALRRWHKHKISLKANPKKMIRAWHRAKREFLMVEPGQPHPLHRSAAGGDVGRF